MMSVDKVLLTPLEKWKYHRIFPWQLVLHVLLIAVVTFQVCSSNSRVAAFTRRMNVNWYNYLLSDTGVNNDDVAPPNDPKFYLYDVDDILTSMVTVITNYYSIKNNSLTKFNYRSGYEADDKPPQIKPPVLTSNVYAGGYENIFDPTVPPNFDIVSRRYEVNASHLGPYDLNTRSYDDVRQLLHISDSITLDFSLTSFDLANSLRTCAVWDLRVLYDNNDNGPFTVSFKESVAATCEGDKPYPASSADFEEFAYFWFPNVLMIAFSIIHFFLVVRDVRLDIKWYRRVLLKLERDQAKRANRLLGGTIGSPFLDGSDSELPAPATPSSPSKSKSKSSLLFNVSPADYKDVGKIFSQQERNQQIRMKLMGQFPQSSRNNDKGTPIKVKKNKEAKKPPLTLENMVLQRRGILSRKNWKTFYWPVMCHRFFVTLTLANVTCFALSIKNFTEGAQYLFLSDPPHRFLAGMAVACAWASLLTWLSSAHSYFVVVTTLSRGLPRVAAFCVGAIPIFMAYALFGMVYFGDASGRFGNFVDSAVSLFAIVNGDILRESYLDLMAYDKVMAQLYLYSFIFFFIYCILAVFIVIMEKSYEFLSIEAEAEAEQLTPQDDTPNASIRSAPKSFRKLPGASELKLPLLTDDDSSRLLTRQRSATSSPRAGRGSKADVSLSESPRALLFVAKDNAREEDALGYTPPSMSAQLLRGPSQLAVTSSPASSSAVPPQRARAELEAALKAANESLVKQLQTSSVSPCSEEALLETMSRLLAAQRDAFNQLANRIAQLRVE